MRTSTTHSEQPERSSRCHTVTRCAYDAGLERRDFFLELSQAKHRKQGCLVLGLAVSLLSLRPPSSTVFGLEEPLVSHFFCPCLPSAVAYSHSKYVLHASTLDSSSCGYWRDAIRLQLLHAICSSRAFATSLVVPEADILC